MSDLKTFLKSNGFQAHNSDLCAILRRCDHDADNALSFEEFRNAMSEQNEEEVGENAGE